MITQRFFSAIAMVIALIAGNLPLSSCAQAQNKQPPELGVFDTDYRLTAGDKLSIKVFGEEDLSGEFFVSTEGNISFPLLGIVQAGGQTLGEFQAQLINDLKADYIKDPKVSVSIITYRPFYILGEVNKPGEYQFTGKISVTNAVAIAGGFTYRAKTKRVFIRRANELDEKEYPLSSDTMISSGDTVRVAERFF